MNSKTTTRHHFVPLLLLFVVCVSGWNVALAQPGAHAATNAPAGTNAVSLSEFDAAMPNGKDPFFPRSTRRALEISSSSSSGADTSALSVQGISGTGSRAFATINNRTFQAGEEGEILTPNGRFRIRCEEIKTQSVVITIGGSQRMELRLPQR